MANDREDQHLMLRARKALVEKPPLRIAPFAGDTMLITPTRIALSSVIGMPAPRLFGALTVYVAAYGRFLLSVRDSTFRSLEFALVPAHTPHLVTPEDGRITKLLIEPETIDVTRTCELLNGDEKRRVINTARLREAFGQMGQLDSADIDVDTFFFGAPLPVRPRDPRIAAAIEHINLDHAEKLSAQDCARAAGLSFSRFTHLFRSETGNTYRGFRAWKHARNFMPLVNGPYNAADVAMQLGYADSPHFSRSIRHVYGLTPRYMFEVARELRVLVHPEPHSNTSFEFQKESIRPRHASPS